MSLGNLLQRNVIGPCAYIGSLCLFHDQSSNLETLINAAILDDNTTEVIKGYNVNGSFYGQSASQPAGQPASLVYGRSIESR